MNNLKLSKRLNAIVGLVDKCDLVADIGCDHGKVLAKLFENGVIRQAIATDISAPSVDKTKQLLQELGYLDRCEVLVGDGFESITTTHIDTCVIAGMGGHEIMKIMENAHCTVDNWILQPMSDEELVRRYLVKHGYCIERELFLQDKGKYYCILKVKQGKQRLTKLQYVFGKDYKTSEDFSLFASRKLDKLKEYMDKATPKSKKELKRRYKQLQKVVRR